MPSEAPAREIVMMSLSTVAGASPAPAPWPRASKPTASTAASTSGSPTICSIMSASSLPELRSTVSQPKLAAWASRSAFMSPTMTTEAPSSCAEYAAARPTGPAPAT